MGSFSSKSDEFKTENYKKLKELFVNYGDEVKAGEIFDKLFSDDAKILGGRTKAEFKAETTKYRDSASTIEINFLSEDESQVTYDIRGVGPRRATFKDGKIVALEQILSDNGKAFKAYLDVFVSGDVKAWKESIANLCTADTTFNGYKAAEWQASLEPKVAAFKSVETKPLIVIYKDEGNVLSYQVGDRPKRRVTFNASGKLVSVNDILSRNASALKEYFRELAALDGDSKKARAVSEKFIAADATIVGKSLADTLVENEKNFEAMKGKPAPHFFIVKDEGDTVTYEFQGLAKNRKATFKDGKIVLVEEVA